MKALTIEFPQRSTGEALTELILILFIFYTGIMAMSSYSNAPTKTQFKTGVVATASPAAGARKDIVDVLMSCRSPGVWHPLGNSTIEKCNF